MKTVCESNKCTGCMACIDICSKGAISMRGDLDAYNAVVDEERCIDCGLCQTVCQKNNPEQGVKPIRWYQGWAENDEIRKKASSGGVATAIASSFIKAGGVVCSCCFRDGFFIFETCENVEGLDKFVGSKYVKSNPSGIYKKIYDLLQKGKKVLFIGLPCQVAALKKYIGYKLGVNLYTIDLVCHGTPSFKLLQIFLEQYNQPLISMDDIQFRVKAKMPHSKYQGIVTKGVTDKYNIAFLNSLIHTENCYECNYAKTERISDLTIGDSWGSSLSKETQKKGISLLLCQTKKGISLLEKADLHLEAVDIEIAVENNHQLKHPSIMPDKRNAFFCGIKKGKKFNSLVFRYLPKQCLKQNIKEVLIKMKIVSWGMTNYGILVFKQDNKLHTD